MSIPAAVATLRAQSNPVTAIAFHSSNLRLVSGDDDGWCIQWSLVTRRPMAVWKSHSAAILTVKWMSDELLLTHGRDNKLYIHRLDNSTLDTAIPGVDDDPDKWRRPWLVASLDVNALNFCSAATCGSNRIAVPGTLDSNTIDVYDLLPELKRPYKALSAGIKTGIVMSIDLMEDRLIAGYESGHVALFQLSEDGSSNRIYLCKAHSQPLLSVSLHPTDSTFISSSADSNLVKHPLYPQRHSDRKCTTESEVDDEALSESTSLGTVDIKHAGIASIDMRDDEKIFAVACWDGIVRVFVYKSLKLLASFKGGRQQGITCTKFGRTNLSDGYGTNSEERVTSAATFHETALTRAFDQIHPKVSSTLKTKQEQKVRNKHWLAVGGKDGRIGLWEIY
ncbi:WD40 repeat-like protein [Lipomyces tetrasporus]|uniref:ASTRA-associated protein 1 n=1 Tax=Lipomyces tetrasporus TaxID=54092 RepID=A0AAD7QJW2_9ASCO|nr:WD40 repeat-like protein [Lipomyces tetrasporus]KAJ8096567.1 WD40 repeat-like protein [Lipomyces tetrasporus]